MLSNKEIKTKLSQCKQIVNNKLRYYDINLTFWARTSKRNKKIKITKITDLSWEDLQALIITGANKEEKQCLLFLYFNQEYSAEEIGFRGVYDDEQNLSCEEKKELDEYILIFKEYKYEKHYQVNEHISKENKWDDFKSIRSNNTHSSGKTVKGIQPKYFAIICKELEIKKFEGTKLKSYSSW